MKRILCFLFTFVFLLSLSGCVLVSAVLMDAANSATSSTTTESIQESVTEMIVEESTEPSKTTESANPAESVETTESAETGETTDPTEIEETTDPTEIEETTDPTEIEETTDPTEIEEATDPTEIEEATDPTEIEEATAPTEPPEVFPQSITILTEATQIENGTAGKLSVSFIPANVTSQEITWSSSAPYIVSVSKDGTYQASAVGTATITAKHSSGVSTSIVLEVLPVAVREIILTSNWADTTPFLKNNTMTLQAQIFPADAADKRITWTSSDESVATVTPYGIVRAISHGTAVITATTANGIQASYEVTVQLSPQKFWVSVSIYMVSNDHVGYSWTTGAEFAYETIYSGSTVSAFPGDRIVIGGWAQENDSRPDYGYYYETVQITDEMCAKGFTVEGDIDVRENAGRYSGNYARWHIKITFTPTN